MHSFILVLFRIEFLHLFDIIHFFYHVYNINSTLAYYEKIFTISFYFQGSGNDLMLEFLPLNPEL